MKKAKAKLVHLLHDINALHHRGDIPPALGQEIVAWLDLVATVLKQDQRP